MYYPINLFSIFFRLLIQVNLHISFSGIFNEISIFVPCLFFNYQSSSTSTTLTAIYYMTDIYTVTFNFLWFIKISSSSYVDQCSLGFISFRLSFPSLSISISQKYALTHKEYNLFLFVFFFIDRLFSDFDEQSPFPDIYFDLILYVFFSFD